MKQLVLSWMLTITVVMAFPIQSFGQDIPDDGEEIEIDINNNSSDTGPRRTPTIVPMTVFYYQSLFCIEVLFHYNIGEVTITLNNLTIGCYSSIVVNSQEDTLFIPLPNSSGLWQIGFRLSDGSLYTGSFFLN